jgi:hypothetical protein
MKENIMKKILLVLLLILFRASDLYTTSLTGNDLSDETSPIVSIFGGHWTALIVDNLIVVALFAILFFLFGNFRHISEKEGNIKVSFSFSEYLKYLYCAEYPVKNILTAKSDYKTVFSALSYLMPYVMIIVSIIACFNNLSLYVFGFTFVHFLPLKSVTYIIFILLLFLILLLHLLLFYRRYKKIHV